jgi:hypothetical protein
MVITRYEVRNDETGQPHTYSINSDITTRVNGKIVDEKVDETYWYCKECLTKLIPLKRNRNLHAPYFERLQKYQCKTCGLIYSKDGPYVNGLTAIHSGIVTDIHIFPMTKREMLDEKDKRIWDEQRVKIRIKELQEKAKTNISRKDHICLT